MDEVLFALPFVYWLIRDLAIFYGLCGVPRGPTRSIPRSKLRCEFGTASPPLQSRVGCSDFKIIFFFFTNRGYCATIICVRANFEFYVCSRKIGSQRFLPRKKASALRLCRIFFGSKIASANFSAALRKLEIEPVTLKLYFVSFYRKAPKALVFRPSLAAVLLPPFPREIDFSFLPVFVSECQP
ncbi:MAG: hypothetical protein II611_04525 [Treponema sp.]|nr:hypothetical protein [Treponema sp.]